MNSQSAAALLAAFALVAPAFAQQNDAELVKQLSNPVSSLISVPFQSNYDFKMGGLDEGSQYKLNFQPVVPLSLNKDWNLIIRTIVPWIHQEDVYLSPTPSFPGLPADVRANIPPGLRDQATDAARRAFDRAARNRPVDKYQDGLGDITQSFFFSPKKPVAGMTLGIGPAFLYPTATDDLLGTEKWAAGPTLVALKQEGPWTIGVLANHLWSFAGNDDRRNVNSTFVQPFIAYATKSKTTFTLNAEASYDWNESQWLVPVNAMVSQLVRIGKLPVSFQLGARYYAEGPSGAPEWGVRFAIVPLFPAGGQHPAAPHDSKSYAK